MLKNEVEKLKSKIFSKVRDLRWAIDHGLNRLRPINSYNCLRNFYLDILHEQMSVKVEFKFGYDKFR